MNTLAEPLESSKSFESSESFESSQHFSKVPQYFCAFSFCGRYF
jgi:hypothetical protein